MAQPTAGGGTVRRVLVSHRDTTPETPMGTWGHEFNQNDEAADFLDDVDDVREWDAVATRVESYVSEGGYEDASPTVAAALGAPLRQMTADMTKWTQQQQSDAKILCRRALEALGHVSDRSALAELWGRGHSRSRRHRFMGKRDRVAARPMAS